MKIIGLTRIRNEEEILADTLNHMSTFCDMIFIYDDCSTDQSVLIAETFPKVHSIRKGKHWDKNRKQAEFQNRSELLGLAKVYANPEDWFVYMDADERIDFDFSILKTLSRETIAIRMKLFDFYITPADFDCHYSQRDLIGPEYRNITMVFRNLDTLDYSSPDQREVHLRNSGKILNSGSVGHYGKAVSLKQFDQTCEYYINHFPKYSKKWASRKGHAIHTHSDFGADLIHWAERFEKGYPLTPTIQSHENFSN